MNLELQQRAVEYNAVIKNHPNLRDGLFEQMPPIEMKTNYPPLGGDDSLLNNNNQNEEGLLLTEEEQKEQQQKEIEAKAQKIIDLFDDEPTPAHKSSSHSVVQTRSNTNPANDILDLFDQPSSTTSVQPVNTKSASTSKPSNNLDLLLGLGSVPQQTVTLTAKVNKNQDILSLFGSNNAQSVVNNNNNNNSISSLDLLNSVNNPSVSSSGLDDLLGFGSSSSSNQKPPNNNDILNIFMAPSSSSLSATTAQNNNLNLLNNMNTINKSSAVVDPSLVITVYEKNDLKITLEPDLSTNSNSLERPYMKMRAHNLSITQEISEFVFGAAVPKSMTLQLSPPSTQIIQPMDTMSQTITIINQTKVSVKNSSLTEVVSFFFHFKINLK
jgi:hypothetical protein